VRGLLLQRTALSDDDIREEVSALERQGHRRLLVLTGEHPKYTFDQFLHVSGLINSKQQ
jgi:2-iminoacetate synthase ThiH